MTRNPHAHLIDRENIQLYKMIKVYAPGGSVYSQIHNIQADISSEKIISFFDTGRQFGVPSYFH